MGSAVLLDMNRRAVLEAGSRFRRAKLRVFGSLLHSTAREDLELDLLVDALPGTRLSELGGLPDELASLLGMPVDSVTPGDLPGRWRGASRGSARASWRVHVWAKQATVFHRRPMGSDGVGTAPVPGASGMDA